MLHWKLLVGSCLGESLSLTCSLSPIVSGQVALHPVFCVKDGFLYDKSLLMSFLEENGGSTPNGVLVEDVEADLVSVNPKAASISASTAASKSPLQASIPATLLQLQNEWDALMLDTYNLKTQYKLTQQQLANALYENDAAKRVIARLIKERDEARVTLSQFKAQYGAPVASAAATSSAKHAADMDVDEQAVSNLPAAILERIDSVNEEYVHALKRFPKNQTLTLPYGNIKT